MNSSKSEVDLDQPNVEEYLTEAHLDGTLQPGRKILLRDLLDISPTLNEAASAIVDRAESSCSSLQIISFRQPFPDLCTAEEWLQHDYGIRLLVQAFADW